MYATVRAGRLRILTLNSSGLCRGGQALECGARVSWLDRRLELDRRAPCASP